MVSSIYKRLGYFFIGLTFGIFFVIIFLSMRQEKVEFCYLPNCRVLKNIRSKKFIVADSVQKTLDYNAITKDDLKQLLTDGNVLFDESDTESEPCKTYVVDAVYKDAPVVLKVKNCPDQAVLQDFSIVKEEN